MSYESILKVKIIKLLLIFSYVICWLSVSTSFDDLLILKENQSFNLINIANFLRHSLVYLCLFLLLLLIFFLKKSFFSKKNLIFHFFIIYLLAQIPGLIISKNPIENISFVVSSLTLTLTIIFIDHFFSSIEKRIFIFISLIILASVFFITFIPHFIDFLNGGGYFYGFYQKSEIFFDKISPRSSGLARTSLVILLIIHVIENFLDKAKKNIFLFTFLKIIFLTCILLFQSRTIIFLTIISYLLIFVFDNKITFKNFLKFFFTYFIIPLFIMIVLANINQYKSTTKSLVDYSLQEKFSHFFDSASNKKQNLRSIDPDISSGRFNDWVRILDSVSEKYVYFGYGAQGDRHIINQTASNGLLYAYSSSGIFGLFFYLSFSILISYRLLKVMIYSFRDQKNNYIYCIIVLVIILRSLLESSYSVFSIDFLVLMTTLIKFNMISVSISDIKTKFLK